VRKLGIVALALVTAQATAATVMARAPSNAGGGVVAYADGRRIAVDQIPDFYCDDFSYPTIQCSSIPRLADTRAQSLGLAAGVDYVTIYDQAGFIGPYMYLSQDYTALMSIGWNDRIGSFKGRNGESGRFWTDWFYTGTSWGFCCNTNVSSLGLYNNTFSSVHRT
jgi:hypothetical protein